MIFDMRTYDLVPGGLAEYRAAVEEVGLPVRKKYGVKLAGWYYTEIGTLNRVVHIWAFRDWAHMDEAKQQFRSDPDWVERYVPRVHPLIVRQSDQIMQSAPFAPQP